MQDAMQQPKPWWASKTIWFNVGAGLVAIGTEAASVADLLPEEWQGIAKLALASIVAVGNVVLRIVSTAQPVKVRK